MLHVWTAWTAPWQGCARPFDLACLELSVRLVSRRGHACRIYTDSFGARQIEDLGLACEILVNLDGLHAYFSPAKWAAAKIHTYGKMSEPFLHLDYDVFLEQDIPGPGDGFAITVQHLENLPHQERFYRALAEDYYRDAGPETGPVSRAILSRRPWAYNCGVLAAHQDGVLPFLHRYAVAAWQAFQKMRTLHRGNCAFAEQMLLYAMATEEGIPVRCLLPSSPGDQHRAAAGMGYLHLAARKFLHRQETLGWVLQKLSLL